MDSPERLGPNDLEPCGKEGARRRHWALAERCATCGTEGREPRTEPCWRAREVAA